MEIEELEIKEKYRHLVQELENNRKGNTIEIKPGGKLEKLLNQLEEEKKEDQIIFKTKEKEREYKKGLTMEEDLKRQMEEFQNINKDNKE